MTETQNQTDHTPDPVKSITPPQDAYITFCAIGGIMTAEDGAAGNVSLTTGELIDMKPLKVHQFATMMGVTRQTLWNWQTSIPDFWRLVAERRRRIGSEARLTKAWNGIWLKACAGNPEAAKLYFANFDPDFRMPTEKKELDIGEGYAELISAAMQQGLIKKKSDAIEGEVVNA